MRNSQGVWRRLSRGEQRAKEKGGGREESKFHIWAAFSYWKWLKEKKWYEPFFSQHLSSFSTSSQVFGVGEQWGCPFCWCGACPAAAQTLEEVGASEGWVTPSMLLNLDVLGGVGGKDTVLIWIHVFFIGRARLRHCAVVGFEFFFPSSFYTCGRTVQLWLNVSPMSHILSDSSVMKVLPEILFGL